MKVTAGDGMNAAQMEFVLNGRALQASTLVRCSDNRQRTLYPPRPLHYRSRRNRQ
jgi:hypothetical protein